MKLKKMTGHVYFYLEFAVENVIPVESFEPPMAFDIIRTVLTSSH